MLVDSVIRASRRGKDSESPILGFVLECYSNNIRQKKIKDLYSLDARAVLQ